MRKPCNVCENTNYSEDAIFCNKCGSNLKAQNENKYRVTITRIEDGTTAKTFDCNGAVMLAKMPTGKKDKGAMLSGVVGMGATDLITAHKALEETIYKMIREELKQEYKVSDELLDCLLADFFKEERENIQSNESKDEFEELVEKLKSRQTGDIRN